MNIFISLPMRGLSMEKIKCRMELAEAAIALDEQTPVKNLNKLNINVSKGPLFNLGNGIKNMAEAEVVYFLPGWDEAKGCRIERMAAEYYGKTVMELDGDEESGYRVVGAAQGRFL